MVARIGIVLSLAAACLLAYQVAQPVEACCTAYAVGKPVVNADQTVIIIWDAATKTQHFIRQASFKSDADDFGFLVPSPSQPELDESGNDAFPHLRKLTEPEVRVGSGPGIGCGCGMKGGGDKGGFEPPVVKVLEEKFVAGFHAAVLETKSTVALVKWLNQNGYNFSPAVEAWAKPYVDAGWKITAMKVAKGKDDADQRVTASALRMSFKTDRPLFPYREGDSTNDAAKLGAKDRLLRIYFLAEGRYQGELTKETPWTGKVAWAGKVSRADRKQVLEHLKLPETTGPAEWWLTEFEDNWPYRVAPADVYFARAASQDAVKRTAQVRSAPYPTDATVYALAAVMVGVPIATRLRRRSR